MLPHRMNAAVNWAGVATAARIKGIGGLSSGILVSIIGDVRDFADEGRCVLSGPLKRESIRRLGDHPSSRPTTNSLLPP